MGRKVSKAREAAVQRRQRPRGDVLVVTMPDRTPVRLATREDVRRGSWDSDGTLYAVVGGARR